MTEPIRFEPLDTVALTLALKDTGAQRSPAQAGSDMLAPQVSLPRSGFDCLTLDNLLDHPVLDPITRKQLLEGAAFRLIRIPCSFLPADGTRIDSARFGVALEDRSGKARVHSIFPQRAEFQRGTTSEVALEPKLTIGQTFELSGVRVGRSIRTEYAESSVTGIWSERGADWLLKSPSDEGLCGTWDFLLVIRWSGAASTVHVEASVDASVSSVKRDLLFRTKKAQYNYRAFDFSACRGLL
jgi:hypothetical protein